MVNFIDVLAVLFLLTRATNYSGTLATRGASPLATATIYVAGYSVARK